MRASEIVNYEGIDFDIYFTFEPKFENGENNPVNNAWLEIDDVFIGDYNVTSLIQESILYELEDILSKEYL